MIQFSVEFAHVVGISQADAAKIYIGKLPTEVDPDRSLAIGMFDPVGIQDLVLTSRRPIGVLGASLQLQKWEKDAQERARRHNVLLLYAGGAQSVVLGVPEAVTTWAQQEPKAFYEQLEARGAAATLTCTLRELALGRRPWQGPPRNALAHLGVEAKPSGFGALLGALASKLQVERNKAGFAVLDHSERRCQDSGLLPVYGTSKQSARCAAFNKIGGEAQSHSRWRRGRSFADLPGGVAYIAIDGTGVGSCLLGLKTLADYVQFSDALSRTFGYEALQRHMDALCVQRGDWIPIMAGGDDLVLAVAASARAEGIEGPLELLHGLLGQIQRAYDEAVDGAGLPEVGSGAGLVVGEGVNARMAIDLARSLVKSAKSLRPAPRFAVDFEYLRRGSMVSGSLEALRKMRVRRWTPPNTKKEALFRLGQRPFSLDRSRELSGLAAKVSSGEQGRRLLYQLRDALEEPMSGLVTGAYLLARSPAPIASAADLVGRSLDGIDHLLVKDEGEVGPKDERVYSSAVPDLVEMATLRVRAGRTPSRE